MADLTPIPGLDPVPQIETDTLVKGGPAGPSNAQAQALLNQLALRAQQIAALEQFSADVQNQSDPELGAELVGLNDGTVRDALDDQSRIAQGVTPGVTTLSALAISIMAAIPAIKPDIKRNMLAEFRQRASSKFCNYVSSLEAGGAGGLVFGSYLIGNGVDSFAGVVMLMAPWDVDGTYDFSVTIAPIGGAVIGDISCSRVSYEPMTGTGAQISAATMTESGVTFTGSGTYNALDGKEVGIRISTGLASGLYEITAFSITTAGGAVYTEANTDAFTDSVVSFCWSNGADGCWIRTDPNSGLRYRTLGVRSGYVPSAVYSSPTAANDANSDSVFATAVRGFARATALYPYRAFRMCLAYHANGVTPPALLLEPGTYTNTEAGAPYFTFPNTSFVTSEVEFMIGCPNGMATLTKGSGFGELCILGLVGGLPPCTVKLLNITGDGSFSRSFRFTGLNVMGVNCHGNAGTNEGVFELDNGDYVFQDSSANNGDNDGFNHHGFGHTLLIDSNADGNTDDGFSPHDDCTFAVWGGSYTNNGKGNIIPAFGAQGYCVGVSSSGATGLSPRSSTEGINSGGFVALANDGARPTVMVMRDCVSDSDINGIVSIGLNSVVIATGCPVTSATNYELVSNLWRSVDTNTPGVGGHLIARDATYTAVLDEEGKILALNNQAAA